MPTDTVIAGLVVGCTCRSSVTAWRCALSAAAGMLIHDLHITVIATETGEILRDLTLDPTRDYQPRGIKPGPPKGRPQAFRVHPMKDCWLLHCRDSSQWRNWLHSTRLYAAQPRRRSPGQAS